MLNASSTISIKSLYKSFLVLSLLTATNIGITETKPDSSNHTASIKGTVTLKDINGNQLNDHSNVVVFIDGLSNTQLNADHVDVPKMSHKGLRFTPRVLPIVKDTKVNFFNDDRIFHNVFSLSKTKPFDLGIYPKGTEKFVQFEQAGLVKVYCNIHPNMVSNILVLNNSLFSKTDANGNYEINNIPDGPLTLRLWYEYGDEIRKDITIQQGDLLIENFEIKKAKAFKQHKNKFGMSYRKKY